MNRNGVTNGTVTCSVCREVSDIWCVVNGKAVCSLKCQTELEGSK